MNIFWSFPSHGAEKLEMNVQSSKPFFAADNVCGLHEVVVNYVSKVISRNTVGFEQNDVLIIFRQLDVAFTRS